MESPENEKCPKCGRPIYIDRPDCMYCGYERPIDKKQKKRMKKRLVSRSLGIEEEFDTEPDDNRIVIKIRNCPSCNRALAPGAKFCTSCGTHIAPELPTPVSINKKYGMMAAEKKENLPEVQPIIEEQPGEPEMPYEPPMPIPHKTIILWSVSIIFLIFTQVFPFGRTPDTGFRTGAPTGIVIGFPGVLWFLYALILAFLIMMAFDLTIPVPDRFKNIRGLMAVEMAVCIILAGEIFRSLSSIGIISVMFIFAVLGTGKLIGKRDAASNFNSFALFATTLLMLILTPMIKGAMLSDTGANPLNNVGFFSHLILNILLLTGAYLYVSNLPVKGNNKTDSSKNNTGAQVT